MNHKRIARVMRERSLLGRIRGVGAKSIGGITAKGEEHAVVPNLVWRMFDPMLL